MIILNRKPINRYINYKVEEQSDGLCRIVVTYFIDKGNPATNIDIKYKKTFVCSMATLPDKIKSIEKNIEKTKKRLVSSLYSLGASDANVLHIIEQKLR